MLPLESGDPATIGPYRLLGVLGAGGMGRVYLGRNAGGRTVAVKVVRPDLSDDPEFRTRFRREVSAARRVTGAHAVPVLDADVEAERPWLATGYVAGLSLREAVDSFGPLPESALVALAAGLARALADVHAAGVIHRDLKPSNVLLTLDGPRLIDFGIARAADDGTLTTTGKVIGSPGYMAPEHISGDAPVGPAVDVFALGGVLVYAASGSGPFGSGDSIPMLWRVMQEPARLDGLPSALRPIAAACLDKQPGNRPTPAEVERQCAALGDARSGWLPGPILEAISRQAVMLLDLDSDAAPHIPSPRPGTPELPSTLIGSAGRPGAAGHPHTPVAPSEASPTTVRRSRPGETGRSAPDMPGRSVNTGMPGQAGSWPGTPSPAPWAPHGVTPGAGHSESPPAQRVSSRRRAVVLGCVAVLLVAAAVISATLAFRSASSDGPGSAAGTDTAVETGAFEETSTPEATAETTAAASELSALPADYAGTWKGTATDGLATYDIVVTLRAGAVGTELGDASNTGRSSGVTCRRAETLTSASASVITLRARLVSGATCMDDGQSSTLTSNPDHTVAYSMTGPIGAITGTLRRQ
ncbi:protein kinase [Nocardia africana]|uniref:Protein kinase n=1 Tax=Nocardia africana TaxID=134964 RepID=A0ABW6NP29_9NOCA